MRRFLEALAETGDVPVPNWASALGAESADIDGPLLAADAAARLDAPGDAPGFDAGAARWAARMLFRACAGLADRAVDAAAVTQALAEPGPQADSPSACWSVDLFLRHLPELHAVASGLAPSDPLVAAIEKLGVDWPLSSVGMRGLFVVPEPSPSVAGHPCLRRMYVDRVIRRADTARAGVGWVAEGVRAALGAHADLAPVISAALSGSKETSDGG